MANEISLSASVSSTKNNVTISLSASKSVDQSGNNAAMLIQSVGTSTEALSFGADIGNVGFVLVKNTDAANYVEFDTQTPIGANPFSRLNPGEFFLIPTRQTSTLYGKANTAACNVAIMACPL